MKIEIKTDVVQLWHLLVDLKVINNKMEMEEQAFIVEYFIALFLVKKEGILKNDIYISNINPNKNKRFSDIAVNMESELGRVLNRKGVKGFLLDDHLDDVLVKMENTLAKIFSNSIFKPVSFQVNHYSKQELEDFDKRRTSVYLKEVNDAGYVNTSPMFINSRINISNFLNFYKLNWLEVVTLTDGSKIDRVDEVALVDGTGFIVNNAGQFSYIGLRLQSFFTMVIEFSLSDEILVVKQSKEVARSTNSDESDESDFYNHSPEELVEAKSSVIDLPIDALDSLESLLTTKGHSFLILQDIIYSIYTNSPILLHRLFVTSEDSTLDECVIKLKELVVDVINSNRRKQKHLNECKTSLLKKHSDIVIDYKKCEIINSNDRFSFKFKTLVTVSSVYNQIPAANWHALSDSKISCKVSYLF